MSQVNYAQKGRYFRFLSDVESGDIFIKPNLAGESRDDVFVLTKDMEVNSLKKLNEIDFPLFCSIVSEQMSKDLAIAYMGSKVESWLRNNFWEMVSKSKK